jgi:hypothetical protein
MPEASDIWEVMSTARTIGPVRRRLLVELVNVDHWDRPADFGTL